jgi:hypothetical protein
MIASSLASAFSPSRGAQREYILRLAQALKHLDPRQPFLAPSTELSRNHVDRHKRRPTSPSWINLAVTVTLNNAAKRSAVAQLLVTRTRRFPSSRPVTLLSLPPTGK